MDKYRIFDLYLTTFFFGPNRCLLWLLFANRASRVFWFTKCAVTMTAKLTTGE